MAEPNAFQRQGPQGVVLLVLDVDVLVVVEQAGPVIGVHGQLTVWVTPTVELSHVVSGNDGHPAGFGSQSPGVPQVLVNGFHTWRVGFSKVGENPHVRVFSYVPHRTHVVLVVEELLVVLVEVVLVVVVLVVVGGGGSTSMIDPTPHDATQRGTRRHSR